MASALVNSVGVAPECFLDCRSPSSVFSSFGWIKPRVSFTHNDEKLEESCPGSPSGEDKKRCVAAESPGKDSVFDFEFRLEDPVTMLPADELFSDGKLVPLHMTSIRPQPKKTAEEVANLIQSPEMMQVTKRSEVVSLDPYVFSPKAPRCSRRWREILGLKKAAVATTMKLNGTTAKPDQNQKMPSLFSSGAPTTKSHPNSKGLKHFLHRNHKCSSASDQSLSLPLLREESELEFGSIPARFSLSSSSSGPDYEDLPRFSLDSKRPSSNNLLRNPPRLRVCQPQRATRQQLVDHQAVRIGRSQVRRSTEVMIPPRCASVDSPRMNSYGKIVFYGLERSSSSPSTFNGGPRPKLHRRGMDRSYSTNVRITPVLNVPVCSLRGSSKTVFGFGQLFSQQKKETSAMRSSGGRNHRQVHLAGNLQLVRATPPTKRSVANTHTSGSARHIIGRGSL